MRADLYLYNNGYVKSRQKAKDLIEQGYVNIDGKKISKPAYDINEDCEYKIEINDPCPYVSRGGLKLEGAIDKFKIDLRDKIALDIGASTGGFTHCMLLNGAKRVYAIDSGTNQLDPLLSNDARVISIENYNARNLNFDDIGEYLDVITTDVSFISQTYILLPASAILKQDGVYIGLIKPQFEVGKDKLDKGGIVKNKKNRLFGVLRVIDFAKSCGLICTGFTVSPIKGGDGNVEFLAMFSKCGKEINIENIKNTVLN